MKIFFNLGWLDANRPAEPVAQWLRDPLAHPDIQRMTEREVADLPFRNSARRTEFEMTCPVSPR